MSGNRHPREMTAALLIRVQNPAYSLTLGPCRVVIGHIDRRRDHDLTWITHESVGRNEQTSQLPEFRSFSEIAMNSNRPARRLRLLGSGKGLRDLVPASVSYRGPGPGRGGTWAPQ